MKKIPLILNLGFAVVATIGLCTYIGYRMNQVAIGIIIGFLLSMIYLIYSVVKK